MGLFDGRSTVREVEDLLDREKHLILAGNIEGVQRLGVEKERLMRRLVRSPLQRAALAELSKKAERNKTLLEASARGFKAVREKITAMTEARDNLKTYGSDGNRKPIDKPKSGFNKRT